MTWISADVADNALMMASSANAIACFIFVNVLSFWFEFGPVWPGKNQIGSQRRVFPQPSTVFLLKRFRSDVTKRAMMIDSIVVGSSIIAV